MLLWGVGKLSMVGGPHWRPLLARPRRGRRPLDPWFPPVSCALMGDSTGRTLSPCQSHVAGEKGHWASDIPLHPTTALLQLQRGHPVQKAVDGPRCRIVVLGPSTRCRVDKFPVPRIPSPHVVKPALDLDGSGEPAADDVEIPAAVPDKAVVGSPVSNVVFDRVVETSKNRIANAGMHDIARKPDTGQEGRHECGIVDGRRQRPQLVNQPQDHGLDAQTQTQAGSAVSLLKPDRGTAEDLDDAYQYSRRLATFHLGILPGRNCCCTFCWTSRMMSNWIMEKVLGVS